MKIRKDKDVVILALTEKDLSDPRETFFTIERMVKDEGENKIVLDLSDVETLYSLQIGTLVSIHVLCYENVAVMKLAGANEKIRDLLSMVGLDKLMEMHHGKGVAAESFTGDTAMIRNPGAKSSSRRRKPLDPRVRR